MQKVETKLTNASNLMVTRLKNTSGLTMITTVTRSRSCQYSKEVVDHINIQSKSKYMCRIQAHLHNYIAITY